MAAFSVGALAGYSSPAELMLQAASSVEWLPLDVRQASWFSSSTNLGAVGGGLVGGLCINRLGRKGTILACIPIYILGWILISRFQEQHMLV